MRKFCLAWLISLVLLVSTFTVHADEKKTEDHYEDYERFVKVVKIIMDKYVDEIDMKELFTNSYKGMLAGLDPYSQFFDAEDLEDLKVETEGEFEGLGIEVVVRKGVLTVITPIVDSPAMRAGILAGDIIVKIDGKITENMTFRDVVKELRGEPGSEVTLTVLHKDIFESENIVVKRAKIQVKSVRGARIVDENAKVGYLSITNFQDHTVENFKTEIKKLKELGMQSLVLDLRFNPGGLLNIAVEISDEFLDKGVIVSTKGRDASQNIVYNARKKGVLLKEPVVVLVNNGSASASEIVAGAIKDNNRGLLLGTKTFGKGSVQSLLPIDDGDSALKLTTARYYTPSGKSIHEKGIKPDVEVDLSFKEAKELHENLAVVNAAVITDNGVKVEVAEGFVDKQLESAINILKGVEIFSN